MKTDLILAHDLAHALDPGADHSSARVASPATLARVVSRGHWQPAPHLELLDRQLLEVAAGRIRRLMVLAPPRHGKSELTSVYFPAWYLGRYPFRRVILVSYEADFAETWGRRVRDMLAEHGPSLFGIGVSNDAHAASRFDLAGQRGGMVTLGTGGAITGRGADLLIIDDPIKNYDDAFSPTQRERVWNWWCSVAVTRLEPGGSVVFVMTRWHEDDLAGRVLAGQNDADREPWTVLRLPALAEEEGDPLGRAPGTALWPARFDEQALARKKREMGSGLFAAEYQGLPRPAAGALFRREWFRSFRALSEGAYDLGGRVIEASKTQIFQTVDPAISTSTASDFTVVGTFALTPNRELLVLDIVHLRLEGADLVGLLRRGYERWHPSFIGVERSGFGLMLIQEARRAGLPIQELIADTDKVSRAMPAAARAETGDIYLLEGAPWREDFIAELLAFPNGKHDDMVDVVSYAVTQTVKGAGAVWMEYWESLREERKSMPRARRDWSTDFPPARWEVD
jgi:predicted phage terminase large subunit-like protein